MSIEQIKEIINTAETIEIEPPEPLRDDDDASTEPKYPVEVLQNDLREVIEALANKTRVPMSMAGNSILSTVSLGLQNYANILLPIINSLRPTSLFCITVAASGDHKSATDNYALAPIKEYEERLQKQYNLDKKEYQNNLRAWEAEYKQIENNKGSNKGISLEKRQLMLNTLENARPLPPLTTMLTCEEPTMEGLYSLMQRGQPGIGIFSSEGGLFLGGYSMSRDNKKRTCATLSKLWDEGTIEKVRASEEADKLRNRRLTIHLMMQIGIAHDFFSDVTAEDQGLFSRMLVAAPKSLVGQRTTRPREAEIQANCDKVLAKYRERILGILGREISLKEGNKNELSPRLIRFTAEAEGLLINYFNQTEIKKGANKEFSLIQDFAGKLLEHACRLAANIALYNAPDITELNVDDARRGIAFANYYAYELLRLREMGVTDPKILDAEAILHWLQNDWTEHNVTRSYIQRMVTARGLKKRGGARNAAIDLLIKKRWLISNEDTPVYIRDKKVRESYRVNALQKSIGTIGAIGGVEVDL
ncbi:MAG: YfjI family protein [Pseudomonadota bacterium]